MGFASSAARSPLDLGGSRSAGAILSLPCRRPRKTSERIRGASAKTPSLLSNFTSAAQTGRPEPKVTASAVDHPAQAASVRDIRVDPAQVFPCAGYRSAPIIAPALHIRQAEIVLALRSRPDKQRRHNEQGEQSGCGE